jgi:hypothetical protein
MTAIAAEAQATPDLLTLSREAAGTVAELVAEATRRVRTTVTVDGRLSSERLEREQHAAHGPRPGYAPYAEARARSCGLCGAPHLRERVRRDRGPPWSDRARRVPRPEVFSGIP